MLLAPVVHLEEQHGASGGPGEACASSGCAELAAHVHFPPKMRHHTRLLLVEFVIMTAATEQAAIRIGGTATKGESIPAEILVKAVHGVQQLVWIAAAATQERALKQRFKPGTDLRRRFTLRLSVPKAGSYELPAEVVDDRGQMALGLGGVGLLDMVGDIWTAVGDNDLEKLQSLVPDSNYRARMLGEFRRMLPRQGDGWTLGLRLRSDSEVMLDHRDRAAVDRWLSKGEAYEKHLTVIGQLQRIDFAQHKAVILYPPTSKEIDCIYLPEAEDDILDARREMFQVTGQFVLDDSGHPKQLTDVRSFEPINLTTGLVDVFDCDGQTIVVDPPVEITPALDPDTLQWFAASVPELNIEASGRTREELFDDVIEQLRFLWQEYACDGDEKLSEDAIELKRRLLARMRVEG